MNETRFKLAQLTTEEEAALEAGYGIRAVESLVTKGLVKPGVQGKEHATSMSVDEWDKHAQQWQNNLTAKGRKLFEIMQIHRLYWLTIP